MSGRQFDFEKRHTLINAQTVDATNGFFLDKNFETIPHILAGRRGYVNGVDIEISGAITDGASTALKPHKIANIVDNITLEALNHIIVNDLSGGQMMHFNMGDMLINEGNDDIHEVATIAGGGSAVAIKHTIHLQLSDFFRRKMSGISAAAFRDKGLIRMTLKESAISGDGWTIDSDQLTVTVYVNVGYTRKHMKSHLRTYKKKISAENEIKLDNEMSKTDFCEVMDDNMGAFTQSTSLIVGRIDDAEFTNQLTSAQMNAFVTRGRLEGIDDIFDNGKTIIIDPRQPLESMPTGEELNIKNAEVSHTGSVLVLYRRWLQGDERTQAILDKIDRSERLTPGAGYTRSRQFVEGVPVVSTTLDEMDLLGREVEVR